MTIEALLKVVPPPAEPFEAFTGPWEPTEDDLGTALPQDYKDFVRLYGSGYFMEFLGIHVPRTRNYNTWLNGQVRVVTSAFKDWDDLLPYPMWPDPEGLIPFGGTDNGHQLFWLRRGPPEAWGVVIYDRWSLFEFETFDCDLTGFLAGLATGDVKPNAFPGLLPCEHLFQPSGPLEPRDGLGPPPAPATAAAAVSDAPLGFVFSAAFGARSLDLAARVAFRLQHGRKN
jgi:hypothetical protein